MSYALLYCYISAKLPGHLFLTMKSPEHGYICILKLPPTPKPNCDTIHVDRTNGYELHQKLGKVIMKTKTKTRQLMF